MELHHITGSQNVLADGLSRMRTRSEQREGESGEESEVMGIEEERERGWRKWMEDEWDGLLVEYKKTGQVPEAQIRRKAGEVDAPTMAKWRKRLCQQSVRFILVDPGETGECGVLYLERNGERATCMTKDEVPGILQWAHNVHGHLAETITMKGLIGRYYWPTLHRDVSYFCRSCRTCQMVGSLRPSQGLLPILLLQPMDLIGMDFIGPLTPVVQSTGARYIVIVVDYFTRYLCTKAVKSASSGEVIDLLTEISNFVEWPRAAYSDNGSHFVSANVQDLLKRKGVRQFPAPKSHPSSVGLSERYVQLVIIGLRTRLEGEPQMLETWDKLVPAVTQVINTRVIRHQGYTSSQLLFGFNLRQSEIDATARDRIVANMVESHQDGFAEKE